MAEIHIVCGPPASGKTTFSHQLAADLGAVVLDSDEVTERLVQAGLGLAGMDPDDRDSPDYKKTFRKPVYETLFTLAESHAKRLPVVIAGPFTSERQEMAAWERILEERFRQKVKIHVLSCPPEERKRRMEKRGEARDRAKLQDWEAYLAMEDESV